MERVGLVALSIALATLLLLGASYGAQWLGPHLQQFAAARWPLLGFLSLLPAVYLLMRRKRPVK